MTDPNFPELSPEQSGVTPAQDMTSNQASAPINSAQGATKNIANGAQDENLGWERATLEKLAFASLHEQRLARRWRNFVRLAWLVFLALVVWIAMSNDGAPKDGSTPHTAVIEIKGEIASGADASAELIVAAARGAFEDEGAQAVVLVINSPGGSPVQAGIINDELRRLKAKHKKPLYAVVEESCASAAYYIAVAADQIFVDKASIVGSIGVLMDGYDGWREQGLSGPFQPANRETQSLRADHAGSNSQAVYPGGENRARQSPERNARHLQRVVLEWPAGD